MVLLRLAQADLSGFREAIHFVLSVAFSRNPNTQGGQYPEHASLSEIAKSIKQPTGCFFCVLEVTERTTC
ncbi:MAG: hypothetical protein AO396_04490 [Candidatus Fermentibacter daniensis]|nr:MAG: hypothetical protein AO396_04490 [Candidatus Fermentibacter daniensis]